MPHSQPPDSLAVAVVVLMALVIAVVVFAQVPPSISDARLLGTWQSDAARTIAELRECHTLSDVQAASLRELFGKLRVTFHHNGTTTSYFESSVDHDRYEILGRDHCGLVLRVIHPPDSIRLYDLPVYRIEFDRPDAYWLKHVDSASREYFRRAP